MKKKNQTVSRQEAIIGFCVLLILAGIALGVFMHQFQFNPAVISHQDLLAKEGNADGLPGVSYEEKPISLPEGMKPMTPPEIFNPDTLYQKINGKAELYLSAGFKQLKSQRIQPKQKPDLWMEAYIYKMETSSNAFSVYSMQRRDDGTPTGITKYSYQTDNAIFLTHGSYYLEVIASQASPEMRKLLIDFSTHFIKKTISKTETLSEFSLFPESCSDQNNISVIPSSAFGFDKLDNVYTSPCQLNGREVMVFLSNRGTPEKAQQLASDYGTFLTTFGGTEISTFQKKGNARLIEIFGSYELFFTSGIYLYGIHEAENQEIAESMAAILFENLGEASK
jgi:hypothetical protein